MQAHTGYKWNHLTLYLNCPAVTSVTCRALPLLLPGPLANSWPPRIRLLLSSSQLHTEGLCSSCSFNPILSSSHQLHSPQSHLAKGWCLAPSSRAMNLLEHSASPSRLSSVSCTPSDDKEPTLSPPPVCLSVHLPLQARVPPEQGTGFTCLGISSVSFWDETKRKGNESEPSFETVKAALLIPKRQVLMLYRVQANLSPYPFQGASAIQTVHCSPALIGLQPELKWIQWPKQY